MRGTTGGPHRTHKHSGYFSPPVLPGDPYTPGSVAVFLAAVQTQSCSSLVMSLDTDLEILYLHFLLEKNI